MMYVVCLWAFLLASFTLIILLFFWMSGVPFIRFVLHFLWLLTGMMAIIAFTCGCIFFTVGYVGSNGCDYLNDFMKNQSVYDNATRFLAQPTVTNTLKTCFFGDGNFLNSFDVGGQMSSFTKATNAISNLTSLQANFSNYRDSIVIKSLQSNVSDILSRKIPPKAPSMTDQDNPAAVSAALTLLTDSSATNNLQAPCTITRDTWLLFGDLCPGNGQPYKAGDPAFNLGQATCMLLSTVPKSEAQSRYSATRFVSCANVSTAINGYVDSVYNYSSSIDTVFNKIKADMNTINTKQVKLFDDVYSQFAAVTDFKTKADGLVNTITNLAKSINCRFVATGLTSISTPVCNMVISNLAPLGLMLSLIGLSLLFYTLFICCAALRMGNFEGTDTSETRSNSHRSETEMTSMKSARKH
jgi:hypothetical protein